MAPFKNSDNILLIASDQMTVDKKRSSIEAEIGSSGKIVITNPKQVLEGQITDSFDGVASFSNEANNGALLKAIFKVLKPGGSIIVTDDRTNKNDKEVILALTVAGLVDIKQVNSNEFVATKPSWEVGSAQALKLPLKKKAEPAPAKPAAKVWTLSVNDEDDLEDESSLLDEDDLKIPAKKDDCEVGKGGQRKACKNCVCGRKEEETTTKAKVDTSQAKSSCGNCYLGDAFRCGSCPYLGTPSFKPGEKVQLSLDTVDV